MATINRDLTYENVTCHSKLETNSIPYLLKQLGFVVRKLFFGHWLHLNLLLLKWCLACLA